MTKEGAELEFKAAASCLFGLEKTVVYELKNAGAKDVTATDGRVFFSADALTLASVNIWSRTAERILVILAQFEARDFDSLFDGARGVRWGDYLGRTDAFPVKGYSINSKLSSVPAMQSVIKKAVAERLKKDYNSPFLTERSGVTARIRFSVIKDVCSLMIDTSGDGLHKRGYRPLTHEAPIKETLAAGIVDLARIRADSAAADPFCGSGTLLIEAALKARNTAPGLKRSFAGEDYGFLGKRVFDEARERAKAEIKKDAPFFARGFDIDPAAVETARANAKSAGVGNAIRFERGDALNFAAGPDDIVLANPPYGERMMSPAESEKLISDFFGVLSEQRFKGLYVISSHADFETLAGRAAARRRKLYNGMINCQLYMYF